MDHYEVIERALKYIEDNIEEPLSVESVADSFNMSKYYFHRLFSAMMGYSLNHYILTRRLNASLKLMQNDDLSLTDIAYQLNFGTQSSFTRAFKRQYGITPSSLRGNDGKLPQRSIPPVVKRPIKNINGDIVTDFTLTEFPTIELNGIAFEVDLATEDYRSKIRSHSKLLLNNIDEAIQGSCYVIYSDCQPNSTRFKVLFGISQDIKIDHPHFFTVNVPQLFCAKFKYSGDLIDISEVLKTDYARFLKISKQESGDSHIELVQVFEDIHQLDSTYHIYTPIKKLQMDTDI
ncbi:helix-turn-helix transcriptional regulator [Gracilibacillus lacisalsi]|uniref:helix-turn-helix transcriptional regulator n=1 Tax=Gracilibacillus lacisalsi TaxID=393087 RepID=UPI00035C6C0C|nr:AraC family transcriptional regulator [Gracilibacillus lacisalsi]